MEDLRQRDKLPDTIEASCLSKKVSAKISTGAAADKDGKKFEKVLARILRSGGDSESERSIARYFYKVFNISSEDVRTATDSSYRIAHSSSKCRIKTDVIVDLNNGDFISMSLKNTKCATVGVLETTLSAWFENFSITDEKVQKAFIIFRDKCRFRPSQLRKQYPHNYQILRRYLNQNIFGVMRGLICGFGDNERAKPQYIVFNDKKSREIVCLSVDDYIQMSIDNHKAQFGVPLTFTRASGGHGDSPSIKVKIYNPVRDIAKLRAKMDKP